MSSFAQEKALVEAGQEITEIGLLADTIPVYTVLEKREGNNSTNKLWYVVIGKEKAGPYDFISGLTVSPALKMLTYVADYSILLKNNPGGLRLSGNGEGSFLIFYTEVFIWAYTFIAVTSSAFFCAVI